MIGLLAACKEQTPVGLQISTDTIVKDSTYTAAAETPQDKSILIEESTGNKCSNCPAGKAQIDQMIASQPAGKIMVMALHFKGLENDDPAEKYYSLENQDVRDLISYLDGDQGQPCAAFDRVPLGGKYFIVRGSGGNWSSAVSNELTKTTPVNLHLTSSYDATSDRVTTQADVAYTENSTEQFYLSLFVLEDGLIGTQDSANFGVVKIHDYVFNDVMRKAITPVVGSPILQTFATKETGRVFSKSVIFTPDAKWNKENCRILAVVHKGDATDKHIVHVAEVKMK